MQHDSSKQHTQTARATGQTCKHKQTYIKQSDGNASDRRGPTSNTLTAMTSQLSAARKQGQSRTNLASDASG